eukprot:gene5049-biopygen12940
MPIPRVLPIPCVKSGCVPSSTHDGRLPAGRRLGIVPGADSEGDEGSCDLRSEGGVSGLSEVLGRVTTGDPEWSARDERSGAVREGELEAVELL